MAATTPVIRLRPPEIRSSVITSVCVASGAASRRVGEQPLSSALAMLRSLGVKSVDLYCFSPGDLPDDVLISGAGQHNDTVASRIAALDVNKLVGRWKKQSDVSHYVSSGEVRALATNLPNVSNPTSKMRRETVGALKKLLTLASMIRCPVLELVAGPDFVLGSDGDARHPFPINTGGEALGLRRLALVESLVELSRHAASLAHPVAMALEMEPGLSYLLNSWQETRTILKLVDERVGQNQQHVCLNLDIGHARLLSQREPDLPDSLREVQWRSRIIHAHISHHGLGAHGADLPLKPEHQRDYQPWIDLLVDAWYQAPGARRASYTVALELEAATSTDDIGQSLECLNKWVSMSCDRYFRRWEWKPEFGPPRFRNGVIVFLDLIGSSEYIGHQDLSTVVRKLMAVVSQYDGFYDKFTGDGLMAVFLEQSRARRRQMELAEQALKCARELRHVISQDFKSLFATTTSYSGCQIGISAGRFRFGDHGVPRRPEVTATGPTVICAARLANDRDLKKHPESAILASNEFYLYRNRPEKGDIVVRKNYEPAGLRQSTKVWMLQ